MGKYWLRLLLLCGIVAGGVASVEPIGAEMTVRTTSGRVFTVPVNAEDVQSITFTDSSAGRPQPPSPPGKPHGGSVSRPAGEPVVNVWNRGGCSYTDRADFDLSQAITITGLITWRKWAAGETSVNYELYRDGRKIHTGAFRRGDCDSNQNTWCEGISLLKGTIRPGRYHLIASGGRLCRNSASGSGFIQVFAADGSGGGGRTGLSGYSRTPNAAISGHNRRHLTGVSPDDCARACDGEPWCVSFDYYKKERACDLSDKRAGDVGGLKTNYSGNPYDHYSK